MAHMFIISYKYSQNFCSIIFIYGNFNLVSFLAFSGKTYLLRISNVGLTTSINFRIQSHTLKLVEVEGTHTLQNIYDSIDVHVGQSLAVLVTLNQQPKDYYIVASTRFTRKVFTQTAVLHYSGSSVPLSGPVPSGPTYQIYWSMRQARTFRYWVFLYVFKLL
jgi:iron transport multicopper oxidase